MKTIIFIIIVLAAGALAGLVHGTANLFLVEPYLDVAIGIENQNLFSSGQEDDTLEFWVEYERYREWQKGGQVFAGVILGTSIGALFGIIFALSRNSLPGNNNIKKALILAGIMWLTIYLVPFLKYPANPPTVGEADTVVLRSILYLSFIAISGFAALAFFKLSKKFKNQKKLLALFGYAIFMAMVFVAMPENPDEITAPMDLVNGFRIMSILGVSAYWTALGIILGILWNRFKPNKEVPSFN